MCKTLSFNFKFLNHRFPIFAVGLTGWSEFILVLWLVDFRIKWGY